MMGMGVIEMENDEWMSLGWIERGDCKRLDNMEKNVVEW